MTKKKKASAITGTLISPSALNHHIANGWKAMNISAIMEGDMHGMVYRGPAS